MFCTTSKTEDEVGRVKRASDSMMARPKAIHFSWLGPKLFVSCLVHRSSIDDLLLQISSGVV